MIEENDLQQLETKNPHGQKVCLMLLGLLNSTFEYI
jgi:hypothetical protein